MRLSKVFGSNVSSNSETLSSFSSQTEPLLLPCLRSRVVSKLLNYLTAKIIRVALTTLAHMLTCVQTVMCVCEGERAGKK